MRKNELPYKIATVAIVIFLVAWYINWVTGYNHHINTCTLDILAETCI